MDFDPIDSLDLLSDTVYREQASGQLDDFLRTHDFPVQKTQIYGLRQIARQQPKQVGEFADHQRQRAERRNEEGGGGNSRLVAEVDFWKLVANLCGDPAADWSVIKGAEDYLPEDLRKENIPARQAGMSADDRSRRNTLIRQRRESLGHWAEAHLPAFFERFCSHALYCLEQLKSAGTNRRRT